MSQLQTNLKNLQVILDKVNNLPPVNQNIKMVPVEIVINHDGARALEIMFNIFDVEAGEVIMEDIMSYLPDNEILSTLSYNIIAETIMVIKSHTNENTIQSYELEHADILYESKQVLVICIDPYDEVGNLVKNQIKINM